jgi:putative transposase
MTLTTTTRREADWITLEQLLQLTGWDRSTAFRKQASGELRTRLSERAANGKRRREYDACDLPAEIRERRLRQQLSPSSGLTTSAPRVVRWFAHLDKDAQDQAKGRLAIIQPMLDFHNSGQRPLCGPGERVSSLSAIAKHVAATSGRSERTIWNWWRSYMKVSGPGALADSPRKDRSVSRFFTAHAEAAQYVQNKLWNERLSVTMIHEALVRDWPRFRLTGEDAPPSREAVRFFVNGLPSIITDVAHGGERAYKEDFAPFIIRDRRKLRANQWWISDHMVHDVWVRNDRDPEKNGPVFGELRLHEAFRPWLTAIQDMKSRRIVGKVWCVTPSSNTISSSLRFALERYGCPESFYVDNGKDYNKVSDDASGLLSRLGIRTQRCIPRHPQSKQIESFFKTLHQRFDVLWRPFYAGTSPKTRPEECDAMRREHERLVKAGQGHNSPLPEASKFILMASQWLEEFDSTFADKQFGELTPEQIFDADLPQQDRRPLKSADVAQLFWERDKRKVCEGGCVRLFNTRYEPADPESAAALTLSIRREVMVACDPLNVGEAVAFALDGKFLGALRSQEMLVHGEISRDDISASMRQRRGVFNAIKRYTSELKRARDAAGDSSELEQLERRAIAAGERRPNIYAMPAPKALAAAADSSRKFVADIADGYFEEP